MRVGLSPTSDDPCEGPITDNDRAFVFYRQKSPFGTGLHLAARSGRVAASAGVSPVPASDARSVGMHGDLYRPLGLHLSDGKSSRPLSGGTVAAVVFTGLVVAASMATSLFLQPERLKVDRLASTASPPAQTRVVARQAYVASPVTKSPLPVVISGPDDPDARSAFQNVDPASVGFRVEEPGSLRQNPSVAHLPDPDLIEDTRFGPLPIRDASGRRPFDVYAGASSGALGARVAIVVGGLGISQTGTNEAINTLPAADDVRLRAVRQQSGPMDTGGAPWRP